MEDPVPFSLCAGCPPLNQPDGDQVAPHAVLAPELILWDHGYTINYTFVSGKKIQIDKVKAVISDWTKHINLRFVHVVEQETAVVRISFDKAGSWSYVGTNCRSVLNGPTMNLDWIDDSNSNLQDYERGVILHEFGHVLGFTHEHQSPDRPGNIDFDEDAVIKYFTGSQGWTEPRIRKEILDRFLPKNTSIFSPLDEKSVMMYFMHASFNIQRKDIKPNNKLSPTDIAFATLIYPLGNGWDILSALQDIGVPILNQQGFRDKINDPRTIRKLFLDWHSERLKEIYPTTPVAGPSNPGKRTATQVAGPSNPGKRSTVPLAGPSNPGKQPATRHNREHSLISDIVQSSRSLFTDTGGRPYVVLIAQDDEGAGDTGSNAVSKQIIEAATTLMAPGDGKCYMVFITQDQDKP